MTEELADELRRLFEHLEVEEFGDGFDPSTYVYHAGQPVRGAINDELLDIIYRLYEIWEEEKDND